MVWSGQAVWRMLFSQCMRLQYTLWNFVPKNLFEQFRRIANFYFLCMTIITLFIDSPVSAWTSITPLAFVIFVTAMKQAYEDWLRHGADKGVNSTLISVVRNGIVQEIKSQDVCVGDLIRVTCDSDVPCDLVLLASSEDGKCYITTTNLDGETNLKTLHCPRLLKNFSIPEQLPKLRAQIECEQPTADLYKFYGKLEILMERRTSASQSSLAGTLRRHWNSFRSSFSGGSRPQRAAAAFHSSRTTLPFVNAKTDLEGRTNGGVLCSQASILGDSGDGVMHMVCRPVSSLDGVELRTKDVVERESDLTLGSDGLYKMSIVSSLNSVATDVEAGKPSSVYVQPRDSKLSSNGMSVLSPPEMSAPLGTENLLLRGARLKNTEYIYGCAVYTGQETKLALNSRLTSNKFSTVEKSINGFLVFFMGVLLIETLLCLGLKYYTEFLTSFANVTYLGPFPTISSRNVIQDLLSLLVLFNYIIPISLYVTIEMQKFLGTLFFEWDSELFCKQTGQSAICNTSDLNEELGQVQYLFTDKTGTLTENNMCFRRCSVAGLPYLEVNGKLFKLPASGEDIRGTLVETMTADMENFLLALALCHTIQLSESSRRLSANNNFIESWNLDYQGSSPDEKALVEAAARCGVVYLGERGDNLYVRISNKVCCYTRLAVLEFTSDRKRMSIVVQDDQGDIWLYCKGAEAAIIPLTEAGPTDKTLHHVGEFALRGLRTMMVACRRMSHHDFATHMNNINVARQTLSSRRESVVANSYAKIESSLTLLGATGVEDKLQEGVQETLESLRAAGIKVWILTGDKVETAVNISYSCGHFKAGTQQLFLTDHTSDRTCLATLESHRNTVQQEPLRQHGLVVDGQSLKLVLKYDASMFREVCMACTAVICCRMSPMQKCEVVQLVKMAVNKPITAAIGDGANDVSMIQEAHVGLGIMGKEGRQAVSCSDFAFAQFRFLRRVLLVHGHWYYHRISTLVLYFFYKNIVFITPQFFYSFINHFSTQAMYDSVYLTFYNVLFTSLPVLVYGLFEQDHSDAKLLRFPHLYSQMANNVLMSWSSFFKWILLGLWHAVMVYFLPLALLLNNDVIHHKDSGIGIYMFGNVVYHCIICVVNLKVCHKNYLCIASLVPLA
ncbi:hypothetical protein PR048_009974 [Dryococelus australis]|uniref:Phospholipid-transporting ATPase n=1 Tax=Dryococelus australis TaxID=614101 RepID=A0ABQ9I1D1_9NEOP|nr:hypothetical protein PR048_009974 [Dryococelus australis]